MNKVTLAIVAVLVVLTSLSAAAQNRVLSRAEIPFRFTAHGQTLEAGTYQLRQISAQIIRIQEVTTGAGLTLLSATNVGESAATQLVFRSNGKGYVLAAIRAPFYQISLPKSEEELATSAIRTIALQATH
jgi:hypothetical protein